VEAAGSAFVVVTEIVVAVVVLPAASRATAVSACIRRRCGRVPGGRVQGSRVLGSRFAPSARLHPRHADVVSGILVRSPSRTATPPQPVRSATPSGESCRSDPRTGAMPLGTVRNRPPGSRSCC
jgi:hypothetical protein